MGNVVCFLTMCLLWCLGVEVPEGKVSSFCRSVGTELAVLLGYLQLLFHSVSNFILEAANLLPLSMACGAVSANCLSSCVRG